MPDSYRSLLKAGISLDFSMGYPDEPGFRAGISRPFLFYDLIDDNTTNLKIFPFQIMDETLRLYKKYDQGTAMEVIGKMIEMTRQAGGIFISIWHNTSLLDNEEGRCWREVFEFMINQQNHDRVS